MLTFEDKYFIVELMGNLLGMFFAGLILLYFAFRLFKSLEHSFFKVLNKIPPIFPRKKFKVPTIEN